MSLSKGSKEVVLRGPNSKQRRIVDELTWNKGQLKPDSPRGRKGPQRLVEGSSPRSLDAIPKDEIRCAILFTHVPGDTRREAWAGFLRLGLPFAEFAMPIGMRLHRLLHCMGESSTCCLPSGGGSQGMRDDALGVSSTLGINAPGILSLLLATEPTTKLRRHSPQGSYIAIPNRNMTKKALRAITPPQTVGSISKDYLLDMAEPAAPNSQIFDGENPFEVRNNRRQPFLNTSNSSTL